MVLTLVISIIAIILMLISIIVFPKIKFKSFEMQTFYIFPFIAMVLIISCKLVDIEYAMDRLISSGGMNPLKIIVLFFSMSFLSIILDELNFFEYLANKALKKANGSQIKLFIILYLLCSVLTIFTSNDIVILTFTPFIIFFSKNAKINPIPYLVTEFIAANTWSMLFIIGNPTNIYIGANANITFLEYLKVMFLPTIFAGLTSLLILFLLFRNQLKEPLDCESEDIKIKDKFLLVVALSLLIICIILLAISNYINLEMYLVSGICALTLLLFLIGNLIIRKDKTIIINGVKRIPYSLFPFVVSMFILVLALEVNGITDNLKNLLNKTNTIFSYGTTSYLSCSLINNIPMSVLYSSISTDTGSIYSSIIGSNIGAFLTPIGALAGIMWLSILKKHEIKFNFLDFIKYGVIISIPTLAMSLLGLAILI